MRAPARLNPDPRRRKLREEAQHVPRLNFRLSTSSSAIHTVQLENSLGRIHSYPDNISMDGSLV